MTLELVKIAVASEVADLVRQGYKIKESFDEDVVTGLADTESVPSNTNDIYNHSTKATKVTTRQVLARVRKFVMVCDGASEIAAMTKELETLRGEKSCAGSNLRYAQQQADNAEKRLAAESAALVRSRDSYERELRERRALVDQLQKIEKTLGKAKAAFGEIEWEKRVGG